MTTVDLWNVYQNLQILVEKRQWSKIPEFADKVEFDKKMRLSNYVTIVGKNRMEVDEVIILTSEMSNIPNHSKDFKSAVKEFVERGKHFNIMIISSRVLTNKIREYAMSTGIRVTSYDYRIFVIDVTNAPLVPKHRILSQPEVAELLNHILKPKESLPKILINDPQVVWLGAVVGEVIEIERPSEVTGTTMIYRIVVK